MNKLNVSVIFADHLNINHVIINNLEQFLFCENCLQCLR